MFYRIFSILFFAILAAANTCTPTSTVTVTATPTATSVSQCNTGSAQCCGEVVTAGSIFATQIAGLLGIVIPNVNLPVGLLCTPINVGVGANCAQQPVCCSNNDYNGLINIGCVSISL